MYLATPIFIIKKKDGELIEVSKEQGERINKALAESTQHIFIHIEDQKKTINSTEIDTIYPDIRREYPPEVEKKATPEEIQRADEARERTRKELIEKGIIKGNGEPEN